LDLLYCDNGNGKRFHGAAYFGDHGFHPARHFRGKKQFSALLANACWDLLQYIKLPMNPVIHTLHAFNNFSAAIDTITIRFHYRFLSVGLFHLGHAGRYTVIIINQEYLFLPQTTWIGL